MRRYSTPFATAIEHLPLTKMYPTSVRLFLRVYGQYGREIKKPVKQLLVME